MKLLAATLFSSMAFTSMATELDSLLYQALQGKELNLDNKISSCKRYKPELNKIKCNLVKSLSYLDDERYEDAEQAINRLYRRYSDYNYALHKQTLKKYKASLITKRKNYNPEESNDFEKDLLSCMTVNFNQAMQQSTNDFGHKIKESVERINSAMEAKITRETSQEELLLKLNELQKLSQIESIKLENHSLQHQVNKGKKHIAKLSGCGLKLAGTDHSQYFEQQFMKLSDSDFEDAFDEYEEGILNTLKDEMRSNAITEQHISNHQMRGRQPTVALPGIIPLDSTLRDHNIALNGVKIAKNKLLQLDADGAKDDLLLTTRFIPKDINTLPPMLALKTYADSMSLINVAFSKSWNDKSISKPNVKPTNEQETFVINSLDFINHLHFPESTVFPQSLEQATSGYSNKQHIHLFLAEVDIIKAAEPILTVQIANTFADRSGQASFLHGIDNILDSQQKVLIDYHVNSALAELIKSDNGSKTLQNFALSFLALTDGKLSNKNKELTAELEKLNTLKQRNLDDFYNKVSENFNAYFVMSPLQYAL